MARNANLAARIVTLALMAVAYATCEVAAYLDGIPRATGVIVGCLFLALAIVLNITLRPKNPDALPSRKLTLLLGGLLVTPVVAEPLLRKVTGDGLPLEMQLVNGLRILGLLLAGLSAWTKCRRLAGVVALFLALFSSAMGDQAAIPYLLVAFALTGGLWLVLEYQSVGNATAATTVGELSERVELKMPYREAMIFGLLAVLAAGVAFAGPKRVMFTIGELMPTSGGTGQTDPFARSGIGDGPEEVAGDNANAAGMVESEKMIEDNSDSLIDAVNDMYGPPHKPKKNQERMVAAGKVDIIQNHKKLPMNRKPSREFETSRAGPKGEKKKLTSEAARGVFEVEGRTPLHVRLVAYDNYDAVDHRWLEARKPSGIGLEPIGNDWMQVGLFREADWYSQDDRHRLKVADLKDNLVPTPSLLTQFRIQRVDKTHYYEWDFDGVLALAGRTRTPPGIVVATQCRTLDPRRLGGTVFPTPIAKQNSSENSTNLPEAFKAELDRITEQWAGQQPRGWPQIASILTRLRNEYTLERKAKIPSDVSPVMWFLKDSRHGPDHLFATSAALLLRSLGYPTRVCMGYYASPEFYDRETDHTPVTVNDLHLWPEVQLKDGQWLVIEPTPGYSVLPPLRTWSEWANDQYTVLAAFARRNVVLLIAAGSLLTVLVWRRRRVWDYVLSLQWWLRPGRDWRETSLRAVQLLDRRSTLAGHRREASQSLADWSNAFSDSSLTRLVQLAEWAAYAPNLPPPIPEADVLPVCRDAIREWSFDKFSSPQPGSSE